MRKVVGTIVGGNFGNVMIRIKYDSFLELGELVVVGEKRKYILEVYDISYGSQMSQQRIELISGYNLETGDKAEVYEKSLRTYKLASAKPILMIENEKVVAAKDIPHLFSNVYQIEKDDLKFLTQNEKGIKIGMLRSGSRVLNLPVFVDYENMLRHHVLIPAQTGKGKSNLVKNMIWEGLKKDKVSFIVFDAHNEYFQGKFSLEDHPRREKVVYYGKDGVSLRISKKEIKPNHISGVMNLSDAQIQAMWVAYKLFDEDWIHELFNNPNAEKLLDRAGVQQGTVSVLKRKLDYALGNIFVDEENDVLKNITKSLSEGKSIIIDTSSIRQEQELLVASIVSTEIMVKYENEKNKESFDNLPVISIVLEEAPRVLNARAVEKGNIFSTIAREGRKFKVGLIAITQLPSLIPREILANMNTKIILGLEMAQERESVVNSSAQDLKELSKSIAQLDIGEAIVSSTFTKFAIPIKVNNFEEVVKKEGRKNQKIITKNIFDEI